MAHAKHLGIVALILGGCGASSTVQVMGRSPAGEAMVRITCAHSIDLCYQRAGQVCRFGFTPVNEGGEASGSTMSVHCDGFGNCWGGSRQKFNGSLIVACTKGTDEQRAAVIAEDQKAEAK